MHTIFSILRRPKLLLLQVLALFFLLLSSGVTVLIPVLSAQWIDTYFATNAIAENLLTISIAMVVVSFVVPFLFAIVSTVITETISKEMRKALTGKILAQDYAYLAEKSGSKIFTVITSDVNFIKDTVGRVINSTISAFILLIASVYLMYKQSPAVAIPIFFVMPLIAVIGVLIMRKAIKLFKEVQQERDRMNGIIDENIKGSMLVRVFVSEAVEKLKFSVSNAGMSELSIKVTKIFAFIFPLLNLTMFLGQLIVLLVGSGQVINGTLTLGELSAFNGLVIMFAAPFIIIGFLSGIIGQAVASLNRINEVIKAPNPAKGGIRRIEVFDSLVLSNIKYVISRKKILDKINLRINAGEKVGIIGITGSGKSSLLQIAIRFLYPTSGDILVNGINASELDMNTFKKLVGFVPQQNFLIDGTVLENIDFGRNLDPSKIMLGYKTAALEGVEPDSKVGERGSRLSGGQKQRITIARALAGNPNLLVMDDSTSKLDSNTESEIWENIAKNYPGLSMLIVAQKISSIKDCDKIHVMDGGKIIDSGTHSELLERSFIYQELELTQSNYQAA